MFVQDVYIDVEEGVRGEKNFILHLSNPFGAWLSAKGIKVMYNSEGGPYVYAKPIDDSTYDYVGYGG